MADKNSLIALAKVTAAKYDLDPALVCAIVEQESGWNEFAIRYEPAFMSKYVAPQYTAGKLTATEAYARAFSWGLMQVMGEVAREEGFLGGSLSELCDPSTGLDAGCKHLRKILDRVGAVDNAQQLALLAWNGGGNAEYPEEVEARIATYA
jgi:soluble lytic murein transglycosylase-like protein